MDLLFWCSQIPPDVRTGAAYQAWRLAGVMASRGHDVQFLTARSGGLAPHEDVEIVPIRGAAEPPSRLASLAWLPIQAARAVSRMRPGLIHAHGESQWFRDRPVVRTFYGSARDEARTATTSARWLAQRFLFKMEQIERRRATETVGISTVTAQALGGLGTVIPCGVDTELFRPASKATNPRCVFIGPISGRKRGELVLAAFQQVRAEYPRAELAIIGPEDPGTLPGVNWLGRVSEEKLAEIIASAWVLVSASSYEGFGVPYLEAMSAGTFIVASPNPGAKEVVDAQCGVLARDDYLAEALLDALRDEEKRDKARRVGPAIASAFDWNAVASAYEKVYIRALVDHS